MLNRIAGLVLLGVSLSACSTTTSRLGLPPPETVPHVDLVRYLGRWFEIASFPQSFQRGCVATLADYSLGGDGQIIVVNQCHELSFAGPEKIATGVARVVDEQTNAKLEVSFQWPFWGDYWIIDLDPDYRWAVVGHPSRDYLWVLSRDPILDEGTYAAIVQRAAHQGFDLSRLVRTKQDVLPAGL